MYRYVWREGAGQAETAGWRRAHECHLVDRTRRIRSGRYRQVGTDRYAVLSVVVGALLKSYLPYLLVSAISERSMTSSTLLALQAGLLG